MYVYSHAYHLISYRPSGITVNPVPSWKPGAPSKNHTSARVFLNWYMNSLKNYHDWQIKTTRLYHSGRINMLYPFCHLFSIISFSALFVFPLLFVLLFLFDKLHVSLGWTADRSVRCGGQWRLEWPNKP